MQSCPFFFHLNDAEMCFHRSSGLSQTSPSPPLPPSLLPLSPRVSGLELSLIFVAFDGCCKTGFAINTAPSLAFPPPSRHCHPMRLVPCVRVLFFRTVGDATTTSKLNAVLSQGDKQWQITGDFALTLEYVLTQSTGIMVVDKTKWTVGDVGHWNCRSSEM